jgi:LPS-assembly protein
MSKPTTMPFAPRCLLPALGLIAILALCAPVEASMFEISMDELVESTWNDQVIARGHVEIRFFGEVLVADEVIYDRRSRKLVAHGNVTFYQADGTVSRASTLNLHDDARDAFVAYARRQHVRIDR